MSSHVTPKQNIAFAAARFAHVTAQDAADTLSLQVSLSLPGDDNMFHTVLFWMIRKLHAMSRALKPTPWKTATERERLTKGQID